MLRLTSPSPLDRILELKDEAEKQKVELTPEVRTYIQTHLDTVQGKFSKGEDVTEDDMKFIDEVRLWVGMGEEWRGKYPDIDQMKAAEEMKDVGVKDLLEAGNRKISLQQWLDCLHVAKVAIQQFASTANKNPTEWIDEMFQFPGEKQIEVEKKELNLTGLKSLTRLPDHLKVKTLTLTSCKGLVRLPEHLRVEKALHLGKCSLKHLPDTLFVGGNIWFSKRGTATLIEDAERLKKERKIKGEIQYD